ncbi:MAG TPA: CPBP family intramembrane glutamic endopeptidase [Thermoanaerobaculia bacterium]|nr:CPBP family intramembrane glutamic endopeptidase [Thermoanaerobaculia bacterium]
MRRLSQRGELLIINLLCFGPFIVMSAIGVAARETLLVYDDRRLYTIIGIELVAGTIAILILRAQGWKFSDFGLQVSMPLTIFGMLLFIGSIIAISGFNEIFRAAYGSDPGAATTPVARASWLAVLLMLAIDPLYEETFEVAYNIRATEGSGAAFGITLSAMIRLACHLYQGPIAPLTILPMGLIFAAVYWKWRRVWPLMVAHGVAGYFALAPS